MKRRSMKARLSELTGAIHGALCSLTPRQRGAARRALNKLTTTNCAWHDHIEARSAWLARNPAPTKKPNTSSPA